MSEARFRSNFNVRSVLHNLETFKKSLVLNKCTLTDYQIGLRNGLEMALSMLKNKEANLINSDEFIQYAEYDERKSHIKEFKEAISRHEKDEE